MNKLPRTGFTTGRAIAHRRIAQRFLCTKPTARVAALLVLALVAATVVATLSFAQVTQKPKRAKSATESKRMNAKKSPPGKSLKGETEEALFESSDEGSEGQQAAFQIRGPFESRLTRAHEFNGDLRK